MKFVYKYLLNARLVTLITGIVFAIPVLFLGLSLESFQIEIWNHLTEYVLPEVFLVTFSLLFIVTILSFIFGTGFAYLNTFYSYSGKRVFNIFNILPMSLPPYILAFIYIALFDVTGIFSLWLKEFLNLNFFFPSIRNLFGLGIVLSLCLSPYVYLIAKQAFKTNGPICFEIGTSMGLSKKKVFLKLLLPLSAPSLFSSLIIVSMEVLADFGTVSLFNVSTFSTAIYRSWFGMQSIDSAKQIALILIAIILVFMAIEKFIHRKDGHLILSKQVRNYECIKLNGFKNFLAMFSQFLYAFFAFLLPVLTLIYWTIQTWKKELDLRYFTYIGHSTQFAIYTIFFLIILSGIISFNERLYKNALSTFFKNIASVGYAIPGTVLSVGIFVMLSRIELAFTNTKILTTTIFGLILGLSIRFFSISYAPIEQSLTNLLNSHLQYLKILKIPRLKKLMLIYLPILKPGILTAALFVSVEVIKEIPITLMMRPFGYETLAIRIFELTSEGEWHRAALPSLCLSAICLVSTILIIYREKKNESK